MRADRRCRNVSAAARDFLKRASALRTIGDAAAAASDLAIAIERDPTDFAVNLAALRWGRPEEREGAAQRIIDGDCVEAKTLVEAIRVQLSAGAPAVLRVRPQEQGFRGWIAWPEGQTIRARVISTKGAEAETGFAANPAHRLRGPGYGVADIEFRDADSLTIIAKGFGARRIRPHAGDCCNDDQYARFTESEASVTVVMPVYDGFAETRTCLESLFAQQGALFHLVVVDDASPDPRIRALLDEAARRQGVTRLANDVNLGFARSVNRALALCDQGDALLLNSDVILSPHAIERMSQLARTDKRIGTVTPFSNNSQLTSYPRPNAANPLPSREEIAAIDEAAFRANGLRLCRAALRHRLLFVHHPRLPERRGAFAGILRTRILRGRRILSRRPRAWFSQCLRHRRLRRARGIRVFQGRQACVDFSQSTQFSRIDFPVAREKRLDSGAPIRCARRARRSKSCGRRRASARSSSPARGSQPGAPSGAPRRSMRRGKMGRRRRCSIRSTGGLRIELSRPGGGAPASLGFRLDSTGLRRAAVYLRALAPNRAEIFDALTMPDALLDLIIGLGAPIDLYCVDLWTLRGVSRLRGGPCESPEEARPCPACVDDAARSGDPKDERAREARLARAIAAARSIRSTDRLSAAFARRVFGAKAAPWSEPPAPRAPARVLAGRRLGVLRPFTSADNDRLVTALGRRLAMNGGEEAQVIVFGA